MMKVIVGLGNPGKNYENTRHNVGFAVIDKLSSDFGIDLIRLKHKAIVGTSVVNAEKLMLVKPVTFMNLSGESVSLIKSFYKLCDDDIIVIYDDVSLPFGSLRVREKGSDGGHNGMKSIISHIGSQHFTRVRIGVGDPLELDLADFVLKKLTEDEKESMSCSVNKAAECIKLILESSVTDAMNKYNKRNKLSEQTGDEQ